MKLIKLIVVLLFAVMILALGLLVASVSGCADITSNTTTVVAGSHGNGYTRCGWDSLPPLERRCTSRRECRDMDGHI
jgi:hypothetical protein